MNRVYVTNREDLNHHLDLGDDIILSLSDNGNEGIIIIGGVVDITNRPNNNRWVELLSHRRLYAIKSNNLMAEIVFMLELIQNTIDTLIFTKIDDIKRLGHIFSPNRTPGPNCIRKMQFMGSLERKAVSMGRIHPIITHLELPLLDNIEETIKNHPNLISIGVHGEAYYSGKSPNRDWIKLLSTIVINNKIQFVLFFNREEDINSAYQYLKGINNVKIIKFY